MTDSMNVVIWCSNPTRNSDPSYSVTDDSLDMSTEGWYKVHSAMLEFERPTKAQMAPKVIRSLEKEIQNVYVRAEERAKELRQEINTMLALENNADTQSAMSEELRDWCDDHDLPHYSADELFMFTPESDHPWLEAFIARWNNAETK